MMTIMRMRFAILTIAYYIGQFFFVAPGFFVNLGMIRPKISMVTNAGINRLEGVWAGTVKLVGTTRETILAEVKDLMENPGHYQAMAQAKNPYGDGCASQRIVAILGQQLRAI